MIPSRKPLRRKQATTTPQPEAIPESIFDALGASDPSQPKQAGETGHTSDKKTQEPSVSDLMLRLQEMDKRVEAAERANMALTAAAPTLPSAAIEPRFNMTGLPDPVVDPQRYAEEVAARTTAHTKALQDFYTKQQQEKTAQSGNADQLWEDFSETYGNYAEDQEGVDFAVRKVIKQAERRGLDVNRYMYANSDRFFRDVVKTYDDRFGQPNTPAVEDHPQPNPQPTPPRRGPTPKPEPEEEPLRTGGIFGGIDGSSAGRRPASPPAGDMIRDLQDIQRKTGYY